jgi:hypothetical protein
MSDSKKLIEDTFAFARYLSWADLQKTLFEAETDIEPVPTEPTAVRKHEWRRFGLMCYWYASLHIVTEAWDQLKFSDPVIDQLLTYPKDFRKLLRRLRKEVERSLTSAEAALREGRHNWATLRAEILREAGVK